MNAIIQQTELNIFIKAFLERICALERGEILIKKHLTLLSKELEENEVKSLKLLRDVSNER